MASSPIADLTYRGYDGPINPPKMRWWVIARMVILRAVRNRMTYVLAFLGSIYYWIMISILTIMQRMADASAPMTSGGLNRAPNPFEQLMSRLSWKDQFLHALSYGQLFFFFLLLVIGIGTISNENRANALIVYLSKPCTKLDYLIGKFVGVYVLLTGYVLAPSLLFWLYGASSFRDYGFLSSDPMLLPKVIVAILLQNFFLTSLTLGLSSLFQDGRSAGAAFAGIYFLSYFFTLLMQGAWAGMSGSGGGVDMVRNLFYMSVDGINIGIMKLVLGTDGSPPFGVPVGSGPGSVPRPEVWVIILPIIVMTTLCLSITWSRIRAVEVVG